MPTGSESADSVARGVARARSEVSLRGLLLCEDEGQAAIVREHLTQHIALTRAEQGCISFEVNATNDPLMWEVSELFASREAFESHHKRVRSSEWGATTREIRREYTIW